MSIDREKLKNLTSFISDKEADGLLQGEGHFTIASGQGREKLVQSVPPEFRNGYAAAGFLHCCLTDFGLLACGPALEDVVHEKLRLEYERIGISLLRRKHKPEASITLRFEPPDKDWKPHNLIRALQRAINHPFSESSATHIRLSRAILILEHCKMAVLAKFKGMNSPNMLVSFKPDSEADLFESLFVLVNRRVQFRKRAISFEFSSFKNWNSDTYISHWGNLCPWALTSTTNLLPKAISRVCQPSPRSMWTKVVIGNPRNKHSPFKLLSPYQRRNSQGWFKYRVHFVTLLEHFVPGQPDSPMSVSERLVPNSDARPTERVLEGLSGWRRASTRPIPLLRTWSEPPTVIEGLCPCRALFTLTTTSHPSRIQLYNWGTTPEQLILEDFPPGLFGLVYWPDLKQSLFGDSWVKDKQFELAEQWARLKAREAFLNLKREFSYIWNILESDHIKRLYRNEVRTRLESWFASEGLGQENG